MNVKKYKYISMIVLTLFISTLLIPLVHGQIPKAPPLTERVLVLVVDGFSTKDLREILREKVYENLVKVTTTGSYVEALIPPFPAIEAPSYASLITGSWPSKTGIVSNKIQLPEKSFGDLIENISEAMIMQATSLWQAASNANLVTIIVTHPLIDPMRWVGSKNTIACNLLRSRIAKPRLYTVTDIGGTKIELTPSDPKIWTGIESLGNVTVLYEARIKYENNPMWILVYDSDGSGIPNSLALVLGETRELKTYAVARENAWSNVIEVPVIKDKRHLSIPLKFKAISADPSNLTLYIPPLVIYEPDKWCNNMDYSAIIMSKTALSIGGIIRPDIDSYLEGLIDERTFAETSVHASEFFRRATEVFSEVFGNWSILVTYIPSLGDVKRALLGALSTDMPYYSEELMNNAKMVINETYSALDLVVKTALDIVDLDKDTLIIVSPYGYAPVKEFIDINAVLAKAGLISFDPHTGEIIFEESKALDIGGHIIINRRVVSGEKIPSVINKIVSILENLRDPVTNESVVLFAAPLINVGQALHVLNMRSGSILYALKRGYVSISSDTLNIVNGELQIFIDAMPRKTLLGAPAFYPYNDEVQGVLMVIGSSIATRRLSVARVIDVAPTIALLLGIDNLANVDGSPILQILQYLPRYTATTTEYATTVTQVSFTTITRPPTAKEMSGWLIGGIAIGVISGALAITMIAEVRERKKKKKAVPKRRKRK